MEDYFEKVTNARLVWCVYCGPIQTELLFAYLGITYRFTLPIILSLIPNSVSVNATNLPFPAFLVGEIQSISLNRGAVPLR